MTKNKTCRNKIDYSTIKETRKKGKIFRDCQRFGGNTILISTSAFTFI